MNDDTGTDSGSAYLFDATTGQQIAKLLPNDGAENDWFGFDVAGYLDDDNGSLSGSANLFETTSGQQIAKLLPDDGAQDDRFGWSVAISGTTVIVGAYGHDDNGDFSGSAYIFERDEGVPDIWGKSSSSCPTTAIPMTSSAASSRSVARLRLRSSEHGRTRITA